MTNIKNLMYGLMILLPGVINAQGIKFEEGLTWSQVLQKAKRENKYIFVDCYATWCGPCKYMDKNIFSNDTVGEYFNEKFVSVKVQMDTLKTDDDFIRRWYADARMLKSKYNVGAFPTYLFFSPNGDIVHRDVGVIPVDQFISIGNDALNPKKQYYRLLEKYYRNELDPNYIKTFIRNVKNVEGEELAGKIANEYIDRLSFEDLFTKDNIQLMYQFTKSSKDRGFIIFKDHCDRINKSDNRVTLSICFNFVMEIIHKEEIKPYTTAKNGKPDWKKIKSNLQKYASLGDQTFTLYQPGILFKSEIEPALKINPNWNNILLRIKKLNLGKNAEFVIGSTVVYYLNSIMYYKTERNWKDFIAAANYYADSFPSFLRANTLNNWAWAIFENSNDKDVLNSALEWSKHANYLEKDDPYFMDTYANLLYKSGRVQEAIKWQEKAVQADKNGRPGFQQTLDKMKKGEKTWLLPNEKGNKK